MASWKINFKGPVNFDKKKKRLSQKLHFRKLEDEKKKLARHLFIQNKIEKVELKVKEQIDKEIVQLASSQTPIRKCTQATINRQKQKEKNVIKCIRLVARSSIQDVINVAVSTVSSFQKENQEKQEIQQVEQEQQKQIEPKIKLEKEIIEKLIIQTMANTLVSTVISLATSKHI